MVRWLVTCATEVGLYQTDFFIIIYFFPASFKLTLISFKTLTCTLIVLSF